MGDFQMFKANSLVTNIDVLSVIRLVALCSLPPSRGFLSLLVLPETGGGGLSRFSQGTPSWPSVDFLKSSCPLQSPFLSSSSLASSFFLYAPSFIKELIKFWEQHTHYLFFLHRPMSSSGVLRVSDLDLHVQALFAELRFLEPFCIQPVDLHSFVCSLSRYLGQPGVLQAPEM